MKVPNKIKGSPTLTVVSISVVTVAIPPTKVLLTPLLPFQLQDKLAAFILGVILGSLGLTTPSLVIIVSLNMRVF